MIVWIPAVRDFIAQLGLLPLGNVLTIILGGVSSTLWGLLTLVDPSPVQGPAYIAKRQKEENRKDAIFGLMIGINFLVLGVFGFIGAAYLLGRWITIAQKKS